MGWSKEVKTKMEEKKSGKDKRGDLEEDALKVDKEEEEKKMVDEDKLWWKLSCKDGDYDEKDNQEQEG